AAEAAEPAREPAATSVQEELATLEEEATRVAAELEQLSSNADGAVVAHVSAWLADGPSTAEAGPLPVVVDDALEGQSPAQMERVLALLLEAAPQRQIVYLTDDDEVVSWAAGAGSAVA